MASKKKSSRSKRAQASSGKPNALTFCRDYLKKNSKASFAEIRDAAQKKGITLYPISYGRAQALEGIVKSKPYGSKNKERPAAKRGRGRPKGSKNKPKSLVAEGVPKRGRGRPAGSKNKRGLGTPGVGLGDSALSDLVETLQGLQRERDDAIATLEKIRALICD